MSAETELRQQIATMLDRHWVAEGYAAPNETVYPWQWLWDSCFHVLLWAELGWPDRAVTELTQCLSTQDPLGFVPHMNYQRDPAAHEDLWGRTGSSSITQPPMYGHAVAELLRQGIDVPESVVRAAVAGLRFLLEHRARDADSGLVLLCHPWESGADDSPRWDDTCPGGFAIERWRAFKRELVPRIERSPEGSPLFSPDFAVASVGFNALIAFNVAELASVHERLGEDIAPLVTAADELGDALARRWDADLVSWVDAGATAGGSGRYRTLDALLPLLVVAEEAQLDAGFESLVDPGAHGAAHGPTGVHRGEPMFEAHTYWRGPAWPQLSYLLWVAARRQGRSKVAASIGRSTTSGAAGSGLAEYWDADTAEGLGAVPQSWAGLVTLMTSP